MRAKRHRVTPVRTDSSASPGFSLTSRRRGPGCKALSPELQIPFESNIQPEMRRNPCRENGRLFYSVRRLFVFSQLFRHLVPAAKRPKSKELSIRGPGKL